MFLTISPSVCQKPVGNEVEKVTTSFLTGLTRLVIDFERDHLIDFLASSHCRIPHLDVSFNPS